jgi:hypothetical protein
MEYITYHKLPMSTKLKTTKLLYISLILYVVAFASSFAIFRYGYKNADYPYFILIGMLAFGLNIAGLIFSFSERGFNRRKATIGMAGNLLLVLINISFIVYVISTM